MHGQKHGQSPRRVPQPRALGLAGLLAQVALCIALALNGALALAAPEREPSRNSFAPQPGMSINQANRLLRGQIDGRAVAVVPLDGGRRGYQVRVLLDSGRILTIRMDRNGRIIGAPEQLPFN